MIIWKDEPKHLQVFSYLADTLGKFNFPHKVRKPNILGLPKARRVDDIIIDTFMGDHIVETIIVLFRGTPRIYS